MNGRLQNSNPNSSKGSAVKQRFRDSVKWDRWREGEEEVWCFCWEKRQRRYNQQWL
ncbi:hypothetical protein LINPERPRIM_LOCUS40286, partial [Linum perenne]